MPSPLTSVLPLGVRGAGPGTNGMTLVSFPFMCLCPCPEERADVTSVHWEEKATGLRLCSLTAASSLRSSPGPSPCSASRETRTSLRGGGRHSCTAMKQKGQDPGGQQSSSPGLLSHTRPAALSEVSPTAVPAHRRSRSVGP